MAGKEMRMSFFKDFVSSWSREEKLNRQKREERWERAMRTRNDYDVANAILHDNDRADHTESILNFFASVLDDDD